EQLGWHAVFGLALVPVALAWLVFFFLAKEPPKTLQPSGGIFSLLAESDARWLCAFYVVTFGGFVGLAGYLPIFFVDRFGITKVAAAGFAALCAASGSFLRPFGGTFADRFGGTRVLSMVLGAIAALAVALATLPGLGATVVLMFCTLGALGIGNGAVFQLVPQRYPSRIGAMTGLVGAAGGVGGFLLPFEFGSLVSSTGTFATGFVLFGCASGLACAAVAWRQRVWRRSWELAVEVAV
ncbi:MAG: MFS transporter, partial [Actinomycetota bacterium]